MIYIKKYTSELCDKFEELMIQYEKSQNQNEDVRNELYGNAYSNFEECATRVIKKLIEDINEQNTIKINDNDYF